LSAIWKKKKGVLPDLIVIGAQKCGTSSLHYYLNLHPEISMSKEKELHFFTGGRNWDKGVEWYKSNFIGNEKVLGEASSSYSFYPNYSGVPERMYRILPDARLIYIVRDPIDRIISHYIHGYAIGWENRPIEDALARLEKNRYINFSKYYMQLEQYLNYFPASNILIMTQEDLFRHRQSALQKAFRFLDVDEKYSSEKFSMIRHASEEKGRKNRIGLMLKRLSETKPAKLFSTHTRMNIGRLLYLPFSTRLKRPVLSGDLKKELIACLKDDVDRLRKLTGRRFKNWCV
jgi:Sulfotransferase domain